jgi:hypothetical protein
MFAIPLPRIGAAYDGGKHAGVMAAGDEMPDNDYLLIDLGFSPAGMSHAKALEWARSQGGDMATRAEGRLLDANTRGWSPKSGAFWLKPQYAGYDDCAWYQTLANGYQNLSHKDYELLARAVRRVPLAIQ